MLTYIHTTIEHLLHQQGGIPADEVDVRFEMPTRDWVDSLLRPTINLFLFDIDENTDLRQTNMQTIRGNGSALQRMPPRRFDLRYLVCAPSTLLENEHLLLWRALATLLKYTPLPLEALSGRLVATLMRQAVLAEGLFTKHIQELLRQEAPLQSSVLEAPLAEALRKADDHPPDLRKELLAKKSLRAYLEDRLLPLATRVGKDDAGVRPLDLWGALEIPPRPALIYTVTAPLDLEIAFESRLVLTRTLRTTRSTAEDQRAGRGLRPDQVTRQGPEGEPISGVVVTGTATHTGVRGVVRDRQGTPQPGVEVSVDGLDGGEGSVTDDAGGFTLRGVRPGSIKLRFCRPGGPPNVITLAVPSESYDIELD